MSRHPSGFTAGALLLLVSAQFAFAVTDTWDGGGASSNISTGANWVDNSAPLSSLTNTDLIFAGNVNTNPNFPVPFSANSIAFSLSSGQFQLFGEPLTIGSGGIKNDDAGLQRITNLVQVGAPTTTFSAANGPLELGQVNLGTNALAVTGPGNTTFGTFLGTGSIWKSGAGIMSLPQADILFDLTLASGPLKLTASTTRVNSGGSIAVTGGALTIEGDLNLNGATLSRSASGSFDFAAQSTINVGSNAAIAITGDYTQSNAVWLNVHAAGASFITSGKFSVNSSTVLTVARGGTLTSGDLMSLGGNAEVRVDGPGSSLNAPGGTNFGADGTAKILFTNGSTGNFGALSIANGAGEFNLTTFTVQNGADVQATDLYLGIGSHQGFVSVEGTGSSLTVGTGTLMLGGDSLGSGSLSVSGGATFTSGTGPFFLRKTGYFNIIDGTVVLNAPIIQQGGTVNFQRGLLSMPGNVEISATGLFGADFTLPEGRALVLSGNTLVAPGNTLLVDGGRLRTAALVTEGALDFRRGTLEITGPSGFTLGATNAPKNLEVPEFSKLEVSTNLTVRGGSTLILDGGQMTASSLTNSGDSIHRGGFITVSGAVTNEAGAFLTISQPFFSGGTLTNSSGGRITLRDGTGRLTGPGQFLNSGLLTGDGIISRPATNLAGGEFRAEVNRVLTFTGANGANLGKIQLQGGAIDFHQSFTNAATGVIQGRGIINFAGGLTNAGAMNFSSGTTDLSGDVQLTGGPAGNARLISSGGGTVTLFDDVVHNGAEIRASDNSTIVFFGAVSGSGAFEGNGTISFEGSFNPGASPGIGQFNVNISLSSGSTTIIEIGGLTAGPGSPNVDNGYDKNIYNGPGDPHIRWNGTLRLEQINGFLAAPGMSFDIFDFDATRAEGLFHTVAIDPDLLAPGASFDFSQLYNTGTITVVPEPSALVSLGAGAVLLLSRRRARRGSPLPSR